MAINFPDSPSSGDYFQRAGQRFQYNSAKSRWNWLGTALLNGGNAIVVPGANIWSDESTTLTSTGCVQLSLNNTTWGTNISVANGGTFYTRWDPGVTCDGAPHGTTITGTITDNTNGATETYSKTIDRSFTGPVSAPSKADLTTSCFTWSDGSDTIYATGCLEFSVSGGSYTQANTAVANGNTVCTRWKDGTGVGTTCADAVHGTVIGGTIESATKVYSASLTIDRQADSFNFTDQSSVALSTTVTSNTVTVSGTNAIAYLQWTPDATNPLTSVQASINGGAFTAVPSAGTYTLEVPVGATVQVRGTTGAANSTGYKGTFTIGDSVASTTDLWTVTTAAVIPSVTAPTITTPISGSTGITVTPTFTTSAYSALNGAGAHASTDWQVATDAAFTNVVASSLTDTANKTSWTPGTSLNYNTTYYVRALHRSVDPISSGYGASISFTTEAAPVAGASYGGGYYGGQINVGGTIYNLVVAPVTSGSLQGQYGGSTPSTIQWKTSGSGPDTTAQSEEYGATAMLANSTATWPMFNWVVSGATGPNAGTYDATNALGTGIGGYNDWYIPAKNELEILYRNLKPTTNANSTSSGANANAVGGATSNYTAGSPAQTTVAIFQSGGSQAFSTANYYWSASEYSSNTINAWLQYFLNGSQSYGNYKSYSNYARAVRRVAA
jgi:hypothetical protein